MSISRFAKSILYQLAALGLLAVTVYLIMSMRTTGELERSYFRSSTYLLISSTVFLGTGIYSYRSYSKNHREYASDSFLLLLTGLISMIASVTAFIQFGGLETPFSESGYTAANVNILIMSVLPLPFFVRGTILAFGHNEDKLLLKRISLAISLLVLIIYILAVPYGGAFRMLRYDRDFSFSASYMDDNDI